MANSESDSLRQLEGYRPPHPAEWTPAASQAALAAALDPDGAPRVRFAPARTTRRRWPAIAGGVAAAAAAALVVALVAPGRSPDPAGRDPQTAPASTSLSSRPADPSPTVTAPPAGPVEKLADVARHTSLGAPAAGQYWSATRGDAHIWVAPDGDNWTQLADGCAYYKFVGAPNPNHVNAESLATLPTDPDQLYGYLRENVSGSGSAAAAVFVAIGDVFGNYEGLVRPDLRAAYLEVLGRVPGVTVRADVAYPGGRATVFELAGHEGLWFDDTTAQEVFAGADTPTYRIVDDLPAAVASRASCPSGGQ